MIIPHIDPKLDLSGSVAIVGSSATLLKTKFGVGIDNFDHVLRFNRAPTEGFEEVAGSKTTLRIINNKVFMGNRFLRWKENETFIKNLRNTKLILYSTKLIEKRDEAVDPSIELYAIQDSFDITQISTKIKPPFMPTSGLVGIIAMVLAGIRPIVFGWSTTIEEPMSHYFNERSSTCNAKCHQWEHEIEIINQLIQNDQIGVR